jgi:hypothetical protein
VASIATIEQTQSWSPEDARPTRAVRAVYEAFRVRAREAANRVPDTTRPPVARRSLSPPMDPRRGPCSPPAQSRLENQGGACQRGQHQKNPEGLSLQHASHPISASAGPRRG